MARQYIEFENPSIEFINPYSPDILYQLTGIMPFERLIKEHTMFSYYAGFMPTERKDKALSGFLDMKGKYYDLLSIPQAGNGQRRYLRYCPVCAESDRKKYGETYWHRMHQMQGVNICPEHNCRLLDSTVLISRKASPMLCAAEAHTDNGAEITVCSNQTELELARYVAEVFRQGINTNVAVGQYLHSKLEGTKYISPRGQRRNMKLLAEDFCTFYDECSESTMKELWQLQKVFTGGKWGIYEVCQLALFLGISPSELCNMKLPDQSQTDRFDGEIIRLRELGLSYPQIVKRLGASTSAVKAIGEKENILAKLLGKNQKSQEEKERIGRHMMNRCFRS